MKTSIVASRHRLLVAPAATLLLALGTTAIPCAADTAGIAEAIDRAAQQALESGAAGLQIAVFKGGSKALAKGYGKANLEHGAPVTVETAFRVASVTKQFTAAAILLLAEGGKLSIDDPLSKTFPDFPHAGEVTIRHLLSHTSGIHNYTDEKNGSADCMWKGNVSDRVAAIARMPALYDFAPGSQWGYSNSGYFLLGAIVEKVSGQPFGSFLKERFFDKLGMTHTALDDDRDVVTGRAAGYELEGVGAAQRVKHSPLMPIAVLGGAGALRSTAIDLAKWSVALFGGKVLKPESFRLMVTPVRLDNGRLASSDPEGMLGKMKQHGMDAGIGLTMQSLDGHQKIGHGGGMPGFAASLNTYSKEQVVVVVLSNTTGDPAIAGYSNLLTRVERIALGLPQPGGTEP